MCDPYLLGFEIVDKNEENNRLVGVFAFRVSGEILMVPVFYLNGKIKGQDLIYRKPVNRFYPNTEKWVNFFVGRGADATGRSVDRRSNADARIHLGIDRMSQMPGSYKRAAEDEGPVDIKALWKEACDNSGFRPEHLDQYVFADFLVDRGMQKEAAEMAGKLPWFADTIALGGLLEKPLTVKQASTAPKRTLEYHVDPPPGATEEQVAAHYRRGYSFVDKRAKESLAAAVASSPFEGSWSSLRKTGINWVAGKDGSRQKVLWAPTTAGGDYPCSPGERRPNSYPEHRLVFLEGPDKGCVISYRYGCADSDLPLFSDDAEAEKKEDEPKIPGDSTPQKGKAYVVFLPELGMLFGEPFRVDSIESTGDVTKINFEKGSTYGETSCRVILRKDLECTCARDFAGANNGQMPRVIGGDAVWIPIEAQLQYEHGMPETAANVCSASFQPPASFQPVTLATLDEALRNTKQASISIERHPRSGLLSLLGPDGKVRLEDFTERRMAIMLARNSRDRSVPVAVFFANHEIQATWPVIFFGRATVR